MKAGRSGQRRTRLCCGVEGMHGRERSRDNRGLVLIYRVDPVRGTPDWGRRITHFRKGINVENEELDGLQVKETSKAKSQPD